MDERAMQFRVGATFIGALIVGGILLAFFGKWPTTMGRRHTVHVTFDYAPGVANNTPVRKSGILIGRVDQVKLTDHDAKVLVTATIDSDKNIYQNEDCIITRDLLGDTALAFVPSAKKGGKRELLPDGATITGHVSDDPTGLKRALDEPIQIVSDTGRALTAASAQLAAAAKRVEDILDPETQKNTQAVLRDSAAALADIRKVLGDEETRDKLGQAMKRLPETIENMNRTFKMTNDTLRQFAEPSQPGQKAPIERLVNTIEITERTLRKFSEATEPGKPAPAEQVAAAMENIGEITRLMRTIMARIEQGEGSLGALLNDRQLYDRLNRAARNVEDVSRQLKPIVADARVFMDKTARHPGVILRDAVKPGVGIK